MQKTAGKNTRKLYLLTSVIALLVVLTVSLALIFTLGARGTTGTGDKDGVSTGTTGKVLTGLTNNGNAVTSTNGIAANNVQNLKVTNSSNVDVYIRARVILTGSVSGAVNFEYDNTKWTYAADNYLYYSDAVAPNSATTNLITNFASGVTGTVRVIVEALQKDAAIPTVKYTYNTNAAVSIGGDNNPTNWNASSNALQYGLIKFSQNLTELSGPNDTDTVKIENTGKQDLDVKFRIASSEWIVQKGQVGSTTKTINWDANAGYYHLVGKLAVGETLTLTFGDANKNNGIKAGNTKIHFTLQDYVVATDVYALVDNNLNNLGTLASGTTDTYNLTANQNPYIYSYNNVDKFVYVKVTTTGTFAFNSAWGQLEGEVTGVSGAVITPKSCSAQLFATAPNVAYTVKVWTAQKIDNPTISVVKANGLKTSTGNYQPAKSGDTGFSITDSQIEIQDLVLGATTTATNSDVTGKWGNLAIKSDDDSDMLVRVSLSFSWGTLSNNVWTPSTDELGFSPSKFYGKGFSFNSEDQSLTYNYNLSKGQCTSALLDFSYDSTELVTMVAKINAKNQALKLTIMVEAIYAVGSQLDILRLNGGQGTPSNTNYYTTEELGTEQTDTTTNGYKSMTKNMNIIYGNASALATELGKYVVYATNNFPVGIRVAVALQWGTYNSTTGVWTPASSPNSSVDLGQYIDTAHWEFDDELGGYNYKCSIPGKCATLPIFSDSALTNSSTGLAAKIGTESSSHSGQVLRVVIMAETTHKI